MPARTKPRPPAEEAERMATQIPLDKEEIARRGQEIYDRDIRPLVEDAYDGKIVVIDVNTGDYEIDDVGYKASERLRRKHPDAVLLGLRIGYDIVEAFGGSELR